MTVEVENGISDYLRCAIGAPAIKWRQTSVETLGFDRQFNEALIGLTRYWTAALRRCEIPQRRLNGRNRDYFVWLKLANAVEKHSI